MDSLISILIFFAIVALILVGFYALFEHGARLIEHLFSGGKPDEVRLSPYDYTRKDYLMTESERKCFKRLEGLVRERYYVFPQVHLSSLFNHRLPSNTSWKGAWSKIHQKSVDFVLVDRETLVSTYAIELDDRTHDRGDRIARDSFVNEIFHHANMPLVRLRDLHLMSDESIIAALQNAHSQVAGDAATT